MKLYTKILQVLLVSVGAYAHDATEPSILPVSTQVTEAAEAIVAPHVHTCACGAMEHVFHAACLNAYIAQFPTCGLEINNDTEGLPENIAAAIIMLANDMVFIKEDGTLITPQLSPKGKLVLRIGKNADIKFCKKMLHRADKKTTLSAEELYQQWTQELAATKVA